MRTRFNRSGQFMPVVATLIFTSVILLYAVMNIYRVSRAKLQAQNLADATALVVAALEAKCINVVIDRNEHMNHMYPEGMAPTEDMLPGLSDAANGRQKKELPDTTAVGYAQLIKTVNRAQDMFIAAYNNFMGAEKPGANKVATQNSGFSSLHDILGEIEGLKDPSVVKVIVYNSQQSEEKAKEEAEKYIEGRKRPDRNGGENKLMSRGLMNPLEFETQPVLLKVKDQKNRQSLSRLLKLPQTPENEVGWKRPKWKDEKTTFDVKSPNGKTEPQIGAGAVIVKQVHLPYFKTVYVQARSMAYVLRQSGLSSEPGHPDQAPNHFRPTYYVQLGYRQ